MSETETDLDLLRQFTRDHAQDAFTRLVRRHLNLVHAAALRQVRSPQLAEEVAQSVFTDLARHAPRLRPDTVLTAWLYTATRRTAIDTVRREARRQAREQIACQMNELAAIPEADWARIEPLLDEAMAALDETDRTAILLRYFENRSLREVGDALGAGEDAAQKRVSRAVERLRQFFVRRGVPIAAAGLLAVLPVHAVTAAPAGLAQTITLLALAKNAVANAVAVMAKTSVPVTGWPKLKTTLALGTGVLLCCLLPLLISRPGPPPVPKTTPALIVTTLPPVSLPPAPPAAPLLAPAPAAPPVAVTPAPPVFNPPVLLPPDSANPSPAADNLASVTPVIVPVGPAAVPLELVWIPPGTFTMGSPSNEPDRHTNEGPPTIVTLTRGYWLGKFEVTLAQLRAFGRQRGDWVDHVELVMPPGDRGPDRPVTELGWSAASKFCTVLTAQEQSAGRLPTGYVYRLPTLAEWEYAARAGTTNEYGLPTNTPAARLGDYAWYNQNSDSRTHPVGTRLPNPWGVYDMLGNVDEWCLDRCKYPGGSLVDPVGSMDGKAQTFRGGDAYSPATGCRVAWRHTVRPSDGIHAVGFRLALAPDPSSLIPVTNTPASF